VWYIHGANSSPLSFQWIKEKLPKHRVRDIEYSTETPLSEVIAHLVNETTKEAKPINIVSHSLGGVIAVAVAKAAHKVNRIVTMSAPFGGSKIAERLRWWYPCRLFEDIRTSSPTVKALLASPVTIPVLSFVSTGGGVGMMREPNDGVVTVESQLRLSGPRYIQLPLNHFEILLAPETVNPITEFLFDANPSSK
jgi:pimeloyl-ACP methyl ester carboxylesterase